jgi:hypothetical protein
LHPAGLICIEPVHKIDQWKKAAKMFRDSGNLIMGLCESALNQDRASVSEIITQVADIEEAIYQLLLI